MASSKIVREKKMGVPVAALYEAITDFSQYPKFLPEVVSAAPEKGSDTHQKVRFELEVVKRFQYTLEFKMRPQSEVSWTLTESNFFKANSGSWRLKSVGPKETLVNYELEVGFGFLVPGWVTKKLTEVNLPKMFESFEERAHAISKKG